MADNTKLKFTQAEVDAIIDERNQLVDALKLKHEGDLNAAREEAKQEGHAEGIMRAAEWVGERADNLSKADEGHGWFEAEIAILNWAAKRLGGL